jgi:hypothetical protein
MKFILIEFRKIGHIRKSMKIIIEMSEKKGNNIFIKGPVLNISGFLSSRVSLSLLNTVIITKATRMSMTVFQ